MATINNGESGSSVRTKLNDIINKVEGVTSINNDIDVTGTVTADGLTVDGNTNGDPSLAHLYNISTGTAAEATAYITNSATEADGLFLQQLGSSFTTVGGFVQDGSTIGSGTGASGGLSIMTRAAADMRFYTNGHTNERLRISSGGDISFYEDTGTTPKMVWSASAEALGIGTSSPTDYIHIHNTADSTALIHFTNGATGSATSDGFKAGVTVGGDAYLRQREAANLLFYTSDSEAARIDASGNLLVGTTDSTPYDNTTADDGVAISGSGWLATSRNDNASGLFNRTGLDGDILTFRKDGAPVGSIGTVGGDLLIHSSASNHVGLRFGEGYVLPTNNSGTASDAAADLGLSVNRFKDLYLSGGVYLGGTGAANKLDDYEEGTWTPTQGTFIIWSSPTFSATYVKIGRMVYVRCYQTGGTIGWSANNRIQGLPFEPTSGASAYATDSGPTSDNGALLFWVGNSVYFQKANASETGLVFSGTYETSA